MPRSADGEVPEDRSHAITILLRAVRHDEPGAQDRLFDLVYEELRQLARWKLAREGGRNTLQPTALVSETYLRLFGSAISGEPAQPSANSSENQTESLPQRCGLDRESTAPHFENRRHFFAAAALAMHRICVDAARRRRAAKRGDAHPHRSTPENGGAGEQAVFDRDPLEILAMDEALERLAEHDPELVKIVRLRYFVDLSLDDTAKVLGISRRTVANRWRLARAWLADALQDFCEPQASE